MRALNEGGTPSGAGHGRHMRVMLWALLVLIGAMVFAQEDAERHSGQRAALLLTVDGAIGPATSDYLARGLRAAAELDAEVVVVQMDTPGGLDTSMREIIRDILASPVPVVTYVHPSGARAASAGTYILYASHVAAMTPGTNLGAATPVAIGGPPGGIGDEEPERTREPSEEDAEGESRDDRPASRPMRPGSAMEAKAVNDAVAYIRSLADMRGRNADWAEKAVREAASLAANDALEANVIDVVARNLDALLEQIHGRTVDLADGERVLDTENARVVHRDPDWRNRFLSAITNPQVAIILMMIGFYGLIFEFMNPGALYPGTIGAISLLTGLYALSVLPVNYAGFALVLLGLALMVAEAFAPSFGILGIGGLIAFALGLAILIDTDAPQYELPLPFIAGVAVFSLGLILIIMRLALKSYRRPVVSGREEMVGLTGTVTDWSGEEGHVFLHGERWQARATAPLPAGGRVRVRRVDGLTLEVEPESSPDSNRASSSDGRP